MTRLRAGQSGVPITTGERDLSPLQNIQTASGAHQVLCSTGPVGPLRVQSGRGVKFTSHLHPVSRLKMRGATPWLTLYSCTEWTQTSQFTCFYGSASSDIEVMTDEEQTACTRIKYWQRNFFESINKTLTKCTFQMYLQLVHQHVSALTSHPQVVTVTKYQI